MPKFNVTCLAFAVLCSAGAHAAPVPTTLTGDGIVWSWSSANTGASSGMFTLNADVSGSTLGSGDIRLHSFELKANSNFVIDLSNPPTASGGPGTWKWADNANLSANGCNGVGGDTNQFCFDAGDVASSVTDDSNFSLSVFFDFSQGVLPDVLHLKVDWAKYNPEGSWTMQDQLSGYETKTTWTDVVRYETRTTMEDRLTGYDTKTEWNTVQTGTKTVTTKVWVDCPKSKDCPSGKKQVDQTTTEPVYSKVKVETQVPVYSKVKVETQVPVTDKVKTETQEPVYKKVKVFTPTWDKVGTLISEDFERTSEVPLPGTLGLLGCGLLGLGLLRRKPA